MGRPRTHVNDRERREYQNEQRKIARAEHSVEFVGIDGEGTGRGIDHRYVLLAAGGEYVTNPAGLEFSEIANFLWDVYRSGDRSRVFAGFYLGYDFTQWLKKLPQGRAWYLFTNAGIAKRARTRTGNPTPFPVRYEGWEFDLLGMKRFKLRKEGEKDWLYINDAGPFWQCSFLSAIDPKKWPNPVCTAQEYEKIALGKKNRDIASLGPEMIEYCLLEVNVLARALSVLNQGLTAMDVRLKKNQWFGPGQAAQAWLNTQKEMPTTEDLKGYPQLQGPLDAARKAYFGGWFEIMAHGHIPGTCYEYDINSAYPYVAASLPCFLHGTWTRGLRERTVTDSGFAPGGQQSYALVHAHISGSDNRIGAMLHRLPDGNILRPAETEGWYWAHELAAAFKAGIVDKAEINEEWSYDPCDCFPPMRRLANLYLQRLATGKDTPMGKGAKLVYNSVYGKLAQSIGHPKYGNAIYASLTTAGCRCTILDAIATHPEGSMAVLMVATDAIFFKTRHPGLSLSSKLGDWEEKERHNLTLFKPGVYWDDSTRDKLRSGLPAVLKARGVNASAFSKTIYAIDEQFSAWPHNDYPETRDPLAFREGWFPKVEFNAGFTMISCKQALARSKWFLAGAVGEETVQQDSWPGVKRLPGEFEDGVFWSRPWPWPGEPSQEYRKDFGLDDDSWLTEDGYGGMLIAEALKEG